MARRVFITAAEVSGDKHAAQLIRSLRQLDPEIIVEGFAARDGGGRRDHPSRDRQ